MSQSHQSQWNQYSQSKTAPFRNFNYRDKHQIVSILSKKKNRGLLLTGRKRSKWKSHESERRLRDATEGRRERCWVESSSPAPARLNLPEIGAPVTSPGFARRIFGDGEGSGPAIRVSLNVNNGTKGLTPKKLIELYDNLLFFYFKRNLI